MRTIRNFISVAVLAGGLSMVACSGSSTTTFGSGGSGFSCSVTPPCPNDVYSASDKDTCTKMMGDPSCSSQAGTYLDCAYHATKCGIDGKTDDAATKSALASTCSPSQQAFTTCKATDGGTSNGGTSGGSSGGGSGAGGSNGGSSSGSTSGGSGGSTSGGSSSSGGGGATPGQCGSITWTHPACGTCMDTSCCSQGAACSNNASCTRLISCLARCAGDPTCENACATAEPAGQDALVALGQCLNARCSVACK